jgi:hypothetical protein
LLGLFGWALVFRSAIGVQVSLLLLPPLIARMNSEEALLESEFGSQYADYRRRTWRLLPFLYCANSVGSVAASPSNRQAKPLQPNNTLKIREGENLPAQPREP